MWFLLFVFVGARVVDGVSVCRPRGWRRRMGVARLCATARLWSCVVPQPNNLHSTLPCTSRDGWLARICVAPAGHGGNPASVAGR